MKAVLFYRTPQGEMSKTPVVAEIPDAELKLINDQISSVSKELNQNRISRIHMKQESEIRLEAACCNQCGLCMVCAGNHRHYESWPPGSGDCFYTKIKSGKPIQENPCSLCDEHDKDLRNYLRNNQKSLSSESRLKNKLRTLIIQRRELFKTYQIDVEVVSE